MTAGADTVVLLDTAPQEDPMPTRTDERPIGLAEIADLLGVNEATPTRWKYLRARTGFPAPDGYVSRTVPYWWLSTIETWARATKRWPGDDEVTARRQAAAARDLARRHAEERRAEVDQVRERLVEVQRELEAAEAAAAEAERLAAGEPVPA